MGWLDPDKIQYNSEDIRDAKNQIKKISLSINETTNAVLKALDEMKKDWDTKEGRKFIREVDTDWSVQTKKYVKVLDALTEMLDMTCTIYSELDEKIQALKF